MADRRQRSAGRRAGWLQSLANRIELARLLNSFPKLVVSRTLTDLEWGPGRVIRGDLAAEVAKLKAEPGRDLVLFAGASIASAFIELDLFDEYRLYVQPIVLGRRGLPLFQGVQSERPLEPAGSKAYPCGAVDLQYRRKR